MASLVAVLAAAATGQVAPGTCVPLTSMQGGSTYTAYVGVGSPPQKLRGVPDTGSYNLVAASNLCVDDACKKHARFSPKDSDSFDTIGNQSYLLAYGQGEIAVKDGKDTVSFFATSESETAIASQAQVDLQLIEKQKLKNFEVLPFDAIVGLGKLKENTFNKSAFLTTLGVDEFTICVGDAAVEEGKGGRLQLRGEVDVGAPYTELTTVGQHAWATQVMSIGVQTASAVRAAAIARQTLAKHAPLQQPPRAAQDIKDAVEHVAVQAGGRQGEALRKLLDQMRRASAEQEKLAHAHCSAKTPCAAIIDSGTSLITLPTSVMEDVTNAINKNCKGTEAKGGCLAELQQLETCAGAHYDALPHLVLHMGGQALELPKEVYMGVVDVNVPTVQRVRLAKNVVVEVPAYEQGVRCVPLWSATDSMTDKGPLLILGLPFLRAYATKFDRSTGGMSVAPLTYGSAVCQGCTSSLAQAATAQVKPRAPPRKSAEYQGGQLQPRSEAVGQPTSPSSSREDDVIDDVVQPLASAASTLMAQPIRASELRWPTLAHLPLVRQRRSRVAAQQAADGPEDQYEEVLAL